MSARPESLWTRLFNDLRGWIDTLVEVRTVTGFDGTGRVRTVSTDPEETGEMILSRLRGATIMPADQVLVIRTPAGRMILAPFAKATDESVDYVSELGGDGTSTAAARADHQHNAANGNNQSTVIGRLASGIARGVAIGVSAKHGDAGTAVGPFSEALGAIGTALGWLAKAPGAQSIAVGYQSNASGTSSIAVGQDSVASNTQSVAIGQGAQATGAGSIAIGPGVVETSAGVAQIRAIYLYISNAANVLTRLFLQDGAGNNRDLTFNGSGDLLANNGAHVVVYRGQNPGIVFLPNRKVGGTAAPLKSYVSNNAGGLSMPAGHEIYTFGPGISSEGYTWVPCISGSYGFGYVRYDLTVAL
jgi:hypothetical protein